MHTLLSKFVALSVENIIWLSRKYNLKYVGFMTPLAKKVPDPWVIVQQRFILQCMHIHMKPGIWKITQNRVIYNIFLPKTLYSSADPFLAIFNFRCGL